jgi:hypothetical protein
VVASIGSLLFILAEEFSSVLNEADEDDDGGSRKAYEEHPCEQSNGKNGELHRTDCSLIRPEFAVFISETLLEA